MAHSLYFVIFIINVWFFVCEIDAACYSCNSNVQKECVNDLTEGASLNFHRNCEDSADLCIVAIFTDGTLYRGCSSDALNKTSSLESCEQNLCNGGLFPKNRLLCHQCKGVDCASIKPAEQRPSPCLVYKRRDSCYTEINSKMDVLRGCVSDKSYKESNITKTCQTSGCNNEPARKLTCLKCNSNSDEGCKSGETEQDCVVTVDSTCEMNVLFGHSDGCFTLHWGESVVRGCTASYDEEFPLQDMKKCQESNCNNKCIEPPTCYVCDSEKDQHCSTINEEHSQKLIQTCPKGISSCYECRDDENITRRGCGDFGECSNGCYTCWNQPLCNSNTITECYSCSSEIDLNCDLLTNEDDLDKIICNKGCMETLQNDVVLRGCWKETQHCSSIDSCHHCHKDNCNNGLIDAYCQNIEYGSSGDDEIPCDYSLCDN